MNNEQYNEQWHQTMNNKQWTINNTINNEQYNEQWHQTMNNDIKQWTIQWTILLNNKQYNEQYLKTINNTENNRQIIIQQYDQQYGLPLNNEKQ